MRRAAHHFITKPVGRSGAPAQRSTMGQALPGLMGGTEALLGIAFQMMARTADRD